MGGVGRMGGVRGAGTVGFHHPCLHLAYLMAMCSTSVGPSRFRPLLLILFRGAMADDACSPTRHTGG